MRRLVKLGGPLIAFAVMGTVAMAQEQGQQAPTTDHNAHHVQTDQPTGQPPMGGGPMGVMMGQQMMGSGQSGEQTGQQMMGCPMMGGLMGQNKQDMMGQGGMGPGMMPGGMGSSVRDPRDADDESVGRRRAWLPRCPA